MALPEIVAAWRQQAPAKRHYNLLTAITCLHAEIEALRHEHYSFESKAGYA